MRKPEAILLIVIILLGIFLRSIEVLNKNYLFGFDQGRDYLTVRKIVNEKKPTLIGAEVGAGFAGLGGIFHGPYYFYSLILPFLAFKGDPYGGLLLMFIFGVLSIFLCYLVTRKIFGIETALIATFLLSVCPSLTSQSRFMWNSHPSTFFILLSLWFTYKMIKNPTRYFFWATFFSGLIYGFELAISVPLLISQFVFFWFMVKDRRPKVLLLGIFGTFLSHLPFFLFEARHGFMGIRGIFKMFLVKTPVDYSRLFANHLIDFWNNFRGTFLLSELSSLLLLIVTLVITHRLISHRRKTPDEKLIFILFLFLLPPVSFLVFMLLKTVVWDFYLIHLHLAYIFLFSFYLTNEKIFSKKLLLWITLVLMILGVPREIKRAINDYYDYGGTAKIRGKIDAIDYIYKDANGEKFNISVFTPPVYDYAYQYLLVWFGQRKYKYIPPSEQKGLVYLLIEPDPTGVWHKGWLETVVKKGKILKEETIPSGFIIQKRYVEE